MLRTFADIMLQVALDVGVAKHGTSATDNTAILPTDPATLQRLKDGVARAREEFYADFADAQFRRRAIELSIGPSALPEQINGSTSTYALPVDWMGPPQGMIVMTGGRGGSVLLTSMDRVRLAHAQVATGTIGLPQIVACEREANPKPGEEARWVLRCYPSPDQTYTLTLRGRWRAVDFDLQDVEPTGHQPAIAAYATCHLIEKGLVSTGVAPAAATAKKIEWRSRVLAEEDKNSPRTLGRSAPVRTRGREYPATLSPIRATNPWNP